jgi:hypothetical protein
MPCAGERLSEVKSNEKGKSEPFSKYLYFVELYPNCAFPLMK